MFYCSMFSLHGFLVQSTQILNFKVSTCLNIIAELGFRLGVGFGVSYGNVWEPWPEELVDLSTTSVYKE